LRRRRRAAILGDNRRPARRARWRRCARDSGFAEQLLDRQEALRVRHLQESKLEMDTLLLSIAQLVESPQHDLKMPCQVFFAEKFCDACYPGALVP
jgi:hypothetical protein